MPTSLSVHTAKLSTGYVYNVRKLEKSWSNTPNFASTPRHALRAKSMSYLLSQGRISEGFTTTASYENSTPPYRVRFTRTPTYRGVNGRAVALGVNAGLASPDAVRKAANALIDRIKDQKVNVGVMFAERKRTSDLITSTATRLASAIRYVKAGKLSQAGDVLGVTFRGKSKNNVQSDWLALQYGWKPLLSDVRGSAEQLAKTINSSRVLYTVSGTGTSYQDSNISYPDGYYWTEYHKSSARYKVTVQVEDGFISSLGSVGALDPLSVAWEVVPYSFVVDWFIPIGSFLSRCHYSRGLKITDVTLGTKSTAILNFNGGSDSSFSQAYSGTLGGYGGTSNWSQIAVTRAVNQPVPSVSFPSFSDSPLSIVRSLNALALMAQAFKRP